MAKTKDGPVIDKAARAKNHPSMKVDWGLKVRESLIERSATRLDSIEKIGSGNFIVGGNPRMGDHFDHYEVAYVGRRWQCSCQEHQGGEFRGLCSHIIACMLWETRPRINWEPEPEQSILWIEDDRPRRKIRFLDETEEPVTEPERVELDRDGAAIDSPGTAYGMVCSEESSQEVDPKGGASGPDPLDALILPSWAPSLRPHQDKALRDIYAAAQAGKRCIIVEAPTGAGKTLIGECAAQMLDARAIYVCTTKSLQEQFMADFPEARMIKGRANYPTQKKSFPEWSCEDCDWKKDRGCSYCFDRGSCSYLVAKRQAEKARIAVANTAYYLAMSNGAARVDNVPGYLGHDEDTGTSYGLKGRGLAIFDEADELENVLLGWVEFRVGPRILRDLQADSQLESKGGQLSIRKPIPPLPDPQKSRWPERIKWLEAVAGEALRLHDLAVQEEKEREIKRWWKVYEQAQWVLEDLGESRAEADESKEPWVYDVENGAAIFKPVRVAKYGNRIFQHAHVNLIVSATIVAPQQFAEDLGIPAEDYAFITVDCAFPKERRPMFATPCANVTSKEKDKAYPALVKRIREIVTQHPDRTLVHTVSYDLARYLADELRPVLGNRVITYGGSAERDWALEQLRGHPQGVLLAPSMERGINLKGNDCRNVIVAKVPWPNMGDKRVKRRKYQPTPRAGQLWYSIQTLRAIIQMTGRGMRSESDWCRTWILDEQFLRLWRECRHLLPKWWAEAVQTNDRDPIAMLGIDREAIC